MIDACRAKCADQRQMSGMAVAIGLTIGGFGKVQRRGYAAVMKRPSRNMEVFCGGACAAHEVETGLCLIARCGNLLKIVVMR